MGSDRNTLDELIPTAHWRIQLHRVIPATPVEAFSSIDHVQMVDLSLASFGAGLADLGAIGRGQQIGARDRSVMEYLFDRGWSILELRPDTELVLGQIGKFWRAGAPVQPGVARDEFEALGDPGFTKAAMSIRVGTADGDTIAVLDTRIVATDGRSHRRMSRHWHATSWLHRLARRQFLDALATH